MSTSTPPSPPHVLTKHRPKHPPRNPSFGKRHASVDGLREVPLPAKDDARSRLCTEDSELGAEEWTDLGDPSTILPFARPYSQPPLTPTSSGPVLPAHGGGDRMSSASLPLPAQIPYHTLPKAAIPEHPELESASHPPTSFNSATPRPVSLPPTAISRPPSISRQRPSTASSSSGSSAVYYPPPEPPTILQPAADSPTSLASSSAEPHAPFLSPAPPPADSWIEVETTQQEYRLNVRLPGFKRDAITLATKKRRILHVVADSWEKEGGGHFERRISFGYDADLVSVRAEFDGDMLRVIVPRRVPQSGSWT